jgi:hypothetical protein
VNPLDLYQRTAALIASRPVALVLIGLVVAFVLIRTSTRLIRARVRWWPGNIAVGHVHLHHEFFGVLIMILAGTLAFVVPTDSVWHKVLASSSGRESVSCSTNSRCCCIWTTSTGLKRAGPR